MPQNRTVLLVDDNRDVLEILKLRVSGMGFAVVCASTAVEALGYLAQGLTPDLIISDVQMPILSGIEFAQMLHDRKSKIPLILTSGDHTLGLEKKVLPGVFIFLPKPVELATLKKAVSSALAAANGFDADATPLAKYA